MDLLELSENIDYNPHNPKNIEITIDDIKYILSTYGIPPIVNNIELYKRAFVHSSYTKKPSYQEDYVLYENKDNCISLKTKSNERLEFLGDGVLELIAKYYLYKQFPKENEGFMTEKKIAIVKNEAIGKIAYDMKLNTWLIISSGAEEKKLRTNFKKLGCLFEAFLGALFLDFNKVEVNDTNGWFQSMFVTGPGFQMAQKFIENVFEKHINWSELLQNDDNYKNILQVKIQKAFKVTPHYLNISNNSSVDSGYSMGVFLCIGQPIHSVHYSHALPFNQFNTFSAILKYVELNGKVFIKLGEGQHKIKQKAEQIACQSAISKITEI